MRQARRRDGTMTKITVWWWWSTAWGGTSADRYRGHLNALLDAHGLDCYVARRGRYQSSPRFRLMGWRFSIDDLSNAAWR
jgi:hypothetical protein